MICNLFHKGITGKKVDNDYNNKKSKVSMNPW